MLSAGAIAEGMGEGLRNDGHSYVQRSIRI